MTYKEALAYLESVDQSQYEPAHENSLRLMAALGNPQDTLAVIHVAGTNGKGSVIAYMKAILEEAGYRVGTFTSPHIQSPRELASIDSQPISEDAFGEATSKIKEACGKLTDQGFPHPTEFECLTALSLLWIAQEKPDVALIEVGMGGRFDATNVFSQPLMTVITSISKDHTAVLGEDLATIAWHKGGIIKAGTPTVLAPNPLEVINVISDCVRQTGHKLYLLDEGVMTKKVLMKGPGHQLFHLGTPYFNYKGLQTSMLGKHQLTNLALALLVLNKLTSIFNITEAHIKNGTKKAKWACRGELIHRKPPILIDGAHNMGAMNVLKDMIKDHFDGYQVIAVLGMLKDKETKSMIDCCRSFSDKIIYTEPISPRALTLDVPEAAQEEMLLYPDYKEALKKALSLTGDKTLLVVTGSLYLTSPARQWLMSQPGGLQPEDL